MTGRSSLPEPIGDGIRRELARFGPAGSMPEVVAAWPPAVGEAIAANAWPARLARDGTLHVATSSSTWAFELSQLEATVLERLREPLGALAPRAVRFAVGRLPAPGSESVKRDAQPVPEVGREERRLGEEIAAPIEDPALRELVARAAAASLAGRAAQPNHHPF